MLDDQPTKPSLFRRLTRGGPRPVWLRYLLLVAFASMLVRIGLSNDWMRTSAVLYVFIPYLIGVAIYVFTPQPKGMGFGVRLWNHMRVALIVMLSTSLLLFEGFLCVLMFMPIYFIFALLVFATSPALKTPINMDSEEERARISDTFRLAAVPLLVLFLSLDGVRGMGPDRSEIVSRTAVLDMSPEQVRANIIDHQYPDEGRSWFLALFPRPVAIEAKSIDVGAVHTAHMEYRRWGVPWLNVHRGTQELTITRSTPDNLHATFTHDDSYLSHYMEFESWDMAFEPVGDGQTRVTLTVGYQRSLAPSWYFGPAMRKAVGDGLEYSLAQILPGEAR